MGCGASKPAQQPIEINTVTAARPKTGGRPKTAAQPGTAARPGTSRQQSSARPPSSHPKSRSGNTPSSRPQTSDTRHRTANRHQTRLKPLGEQPEDVAISDAVRDLAAIIEGHSRNYFPRTYTYEVCKEIGQSIVNFAIKGDDNVNGIITQILDNLQRYEPKDSVKREPHLRGLVEEGRRIGDMIAQHRGNWSFGPWDEGVKFPSLDKNGVEVLPPRD